MLFIAAGGILRLAAPASGYGAWTWGAGLVLTGVPVVWRTVRGMLRGHFASDVVAMLAVAAAMALRQPLAGLVIVLMQTGGEALEAYARGRASDAVRELEEAAPRHARVVRGDAVVEVDADDVLAGDLLLVRPGELIPCDGVVEQGHSQVDASRLTGEPVPVGAGPGTEVMSGSVNGHSPLRIRASAPAREGRYARIVQLVRAAQESKAPIQRLADRYAVWFTPVTVVVCAVAWGLSGDPLRALAVLVVATPCPLILATPVAIIGGINRAARRQVIVRQGGALEQLAQVTVAVFDKTGTLTVGLPSVQGVTPAPGVDAGHALCLAAAVEQGSGHLLARTLVQAAERTGAPIPTAEHVVESAGRGVRGRVGGHDVAVGS
ncbi:MAG TPA: HAD-IC family P-type ATPase, partial [Longimicrobiaceae bacterium]|nr:HAD-IC family P-type ATPase [Longimicrobiaceae bacterium]